MFFWKPPATAIAPSHWNYSSTRRASSCWWTKRSSAPPWRKLLADGDLVQETDRRPGTGFSASLKRAEEGIARRIRKLCALPPAYPPIDFDKAVEWCQGKTGKELAPSQRTALQQALSSRVLVITGGPGVGKTTLVNAILKILRAKKVKCLLCAPDRAGSQTPFRNYWDRSQDHPPAAGSPVRPPAGSPATKPIRWLAISWSWTKPQWWT